MSRVRKSAAISRIQNNHHICLTQWFQISTNYMYKGKELHSIIRDEIKVKRHWLTSFSDRIEALMSCLFVRHQILQSSDCKQSQTHKSDFRHDRLFPIRIGLQRTINSALATALIKWKHPYKDQKQIKMLKYTTMKIALVFKQSTLKNGRRWMEQAPAWVFSRASWAS